MVVTRALQRNKVYIHAYDQAGEEHCVLQLLSLNKLCWMLIQISIEANITKNAKQC